MNIKLILSKSQSIHLHFGKDRIIKIIYTLETLKWDRIFSSTKIYIIVGLNPKVENNTVKTLMLRKLGHEIINIHDDMLTPANLNCGKYDILRYNAKLKDFKLKSFKICFIRNPYGRLISGIRQILGSLCNFKNF